MGYRLGVDLGTTWTAAAVWSDDRATIVPLGTHQAAVPSVVCLPPEGGVLTGDGAQRRALSEPEHIAREFKRRIGDDTPLIVAGSPRPAEELTGLLLRDVVDQVSELQGARPDELALSHPAPWGGHKIRRLDDAARTAGWNPEEVLKISEPVAAATSYALQNRVESGQRVCVYDLGGGTFDIAILERTAAGFAVLGRPDGLDDVGGLDVDAAVFGHVVEILGTRYDDLDPTDGPTVLAIARLRQECNRAKEALSADLDTVIPVQVPGHQATVRLTRSELEQLIRPSLLQTVETTRRAIEAARLELSDIDRVLLVGGSSRIPLVAQLVGSELGLTTTVDAHPKHAIALGTAIHQLPAAAPNAHRPPDPPSNPPVPATGAGGVGSAEGADSASLPPLPPPSAAWAPPVPAAQQAGSSANPGTPASRPPDPPGAAGTEFPRHHSRHPAPTEIGTPDTRPPDPSGEATEVASPPMPPADRAPGHPAKAVRVANPTNPPPGPGAGPVPAHRPVGMPVVDPAHPPEDAGRPPGLGGDRDASPTVGDQATAGRDPFSPPPGGRARPPDPPRNERPPQPPRPSQPPGTAPPGAGVPSDGQATSVLDTSALAGHSGSRSPVSSGGATSSDPQEGETRVLPTAGAGFDASATRVFDPSARYGSSSGSGSSPPDATSVSPDRGPSVGTDDRSERRGLVLALIGLMVVAAIAVLLLQPETGFGRDDAAATSSTEPDTGDGAPTEETVAEEDMADPIEVPDLTGQPADRAEIRLVALGFTVETERDPTSGEPADTVIGQSVTGGELAEGGSTIVLTVSGGEPGLTVPDIVGLPRSEAGPIFQEQGFTDVEVQREPSQTVTAGSVIRTDPPAGAAVETDTPIIVVISSGVEIATVPDVTEQSEADAVATLESAGFDVEITEVDGAEGVVVGQTPAGGGQRVLPFTITIEVGRSG